MHRTSKSKSELSKKMKQKMIKSQPLPHLPP